jgi:hypothetical protein
MFNRDAPNVSVDEWRARVARLTNAEADIRQRIESRSSRLASATVSGHDTVQDRLFWVLARLGAQRRAAAGQLALISSNAARRKQLEG